MRDREPVADVALAQGFDEGWRKASTRIAACAGSP
jgi:hypothetical protein